MLTFFIGLITGFAFGLIALGCLSASRANNDETHK